MLKKRLESFENDLDNDVQKFTEECAKIENKEDRMSKLKKVIFNDIH